MFPVPVNSERGMATAGKCKIAGLGYQVKSFSLHSLTERDPTLFLEETSAKIRKEKGEIYALWGEKELGRESEGEGTIYGVDNVCPPISPALCMVNVDKDCVIGDNYDPKDGVVRLCGGGATKKDTKIPR